MMVLRVTGDLIGDACDRLAELVPTLDVAVLRTFESELRAAYGGEDLYVQKRRKPPEVTAEQINPNEPIMDQAERLGRPPYHLYRLLRRKKQRGGHL